MLDKFRIALGYTKNGASLFCQDCKNEDYSLGYTYKQGRLRAELWVKNEVRLSSAALIYDFVYQDNYKVFCNGYQSWSYTREYSKGEKLKGLKSISKYPPIKKFAYTSGEYHFVDYPEKAGEFHSITYGYIRNEDEYTLIGSLCERAGYTIIRYSFNQNSLRIEKDVEGKLLKAGDKITLFDLYYEKGDYNAVFDNYFKVMGVSKPKINRLCGYTSWYNYFGKITEEIILRDLEGLSKVAGKEAHIFQIDDGYQTAVGDWLSVDAVKFSRGMKFIADTIHGKGYLAGIWLAPFNCQKDSVIAREHPEWLIKDTAGKLIVSSIAWGGAYTLNFYIPEVRDYLKKVFGEVLNTWGYDMVKLDFLYSICMYPMYDKSRGEIMCEAMDFLRECVGDKYILGCGVPLGAAFGRVDFCRIGSDVHTAYRDPFYVKLLNREIISTRTAITNTIFRRHLNGRVFLNDPDVFILRNSKKEFPGMESPQLKYTPEQKELLALVNSIFGDVLFVSDNTGVYGEEQKQILLNAYKGYGYKVLSADSDSEDNCRILLKKDDTVYALEFNIRKGDYTLKEV